jgi:4-amino-4-deoxy-L-arabinose transferase-like glycosyltransferase
MEKIQPWLDKWFVRLLIPAILINASGLFIHIIEPDGALYATISRTIAETGDFIRLRVEGKDWLDKPHFPFWMAALSMRVFGINSFAYKLPALLFWAAGGWYVYRLGKDLYGKAVGQLSVLVYVSAAHLVISNNDVRAEPYLTGLVIGAVYHFYRVARGGFGWHLVAGSLLTACAMMTKGPFVLVTIGGGFVVDWVAGKEWEQFRTVRWWIALLLIGIFIIPELYCLYVQFDLHPEKNIFGHTGVSGIRFFFWDSQFGRFLNTGPIKGSGDPFFYFHTLLWLFYPGRCCCMGRCLAGSEGLYGGRSRAISFVWGPLCLALLCSRCRDFSCLII